MLSIQLRRPISNLPAGIILQLDSEKGKLAVRAIRRLLALSLRSGIVFGSGRLGLFAPVACVRDGFAVIVRRAPQLDEALAGGSGVRLDRVEKLVF